MTFPTATNPISANGSDLTQRHLYYLAENARKFRFASMPNDQSLRFTVSLTQLTKSAR